MASFHPTHAVPASGLDAWSLPDPALPPAARLDPWLTVEVIALHGGWAQVRCANDWTCWVDANALVAAPPGPGVDAAGASPASAYASAPPIPPAPTVGGYPGAGYSAAGYPGTGYPGGSYPGGSYPGGSYPETGYAVAGFPPPPAPGRARPRGSSGAGMAVRVIGTAIGAGAMALGGYLTWLRVAGTSGVSGKDIPAQVLVDRNTSATGPVSIAGLLVILAVVALLASLWRPISFVRRLAGLAAMAVAALFSLQTLRAILDVSVGTPGAPTLWSALGMGIAVAFAGGVIVLLTPRG